MATASVFDVSRTVLSDENGNHSRNQTGQCTPMPLPALGIQQIIEGNGTSVGTRISLQCPSKHRLVGDRVLSCVWGRNSTQWSGNAPLCRPLTRYEDQGFRVAVVASIVSCAIIFLMSMVFITSGLLKCVKREERRHKRETDLWHQLECSELDEMRPYYAHKGRNNNNSNAKKMKPLRDNHDPTMCDHPGHCRFYHQYPYPVSRPSGPSLGRAPFSAPLPGTRYDHSEGPFSQNQLQKQCPAPNQDTPPQNPVLPRRYESGPGSGSAVKRPLLDNTNREYRHALGGPARPIHVISV